MYRVDTFLILKSFFCSIFNTRNMKSKKQTLRRWVVINNSYKFPQTRTIHMQEKLRKKSPQYQKHWEMCLFKAEIFSTKHYKANSLKTFGCPFARGEQRIYSPLPAGFRKVSQKWWCKTAAGRSQCFTSRISPALLESWARAGPCAPCTLRCVRYLRLHSRGLCRSIEFPPSPSPCLALI